jgi:hypothetical protein
MSETTDAIADAALQQRIRAAFFYKLYADSALELMVITCEILDICPTIAQEHKLRRAFEAFLEQWEQEIAE